MKQSRLFIFLVALLLSSALLIGAVSNGQNSDRAKVYTRIELLADILSKIDHNYVSDVDHADLMEAAIEGMVSSLDPHSSYLSAERYKDMQVQAKGEYGGLGLEVTINEDEIVTVVSPIDDTPASRAGVESGDLIVGIDGESIIGADLNEAVSRMRGKVGEPITITIRRGVEAPFDVRIVRDLITVRSVSYEADNEIGYIRISTFNEKTGGAVRDAIDALKKEAKPALRGVVLDLRNNPGGLLDQSIAVAEVFLDGGEVASIRGRDDSNIVRHNANDNELLENVPVAVLINGGSASASEIVAGALQDRGRAVVMGRTSYGKGSVQNVMPLQIRGEDMGALRLTTARYYTPSGRSIQALGITPDFEVFQLRKEDEPERQRVREAGLRNSLNNEEEADTEKNDADAEKNETGDIAVEDVKREAESRINDTLSDAATVNEQSIASAEQEEEPEEVKRDEPPKDFDYRKGDYQRQRAVEYLRNLQSKTVSVASGKG